MKQELTKGNIVQVIIRFAVPYLISCFLQNFYGVADLFITGQFNGAATITAVSTGSQIMHMITVIIVGLAMGATVSISHGAGAKDNQNVSKTIGNAVSLFLIFSLGFTILLLFLVDGIIGVISTPVESIGETRQYLMVCFAGVPFITAYNVIGSIFRGLGDTKRPMYIVFATGVINVVLDFLLIGPCGMGAMGAALATVAAQGLSVIVALILLKKGDNGIHLERKDFVFEKQILRNILTVGVPVSCQDGFIQISFLVITAIANGRGVVIAASVGIVEKIISFLFLVPSAMLSTVSAITAQNVGANEHKRGKETLKYGIFICLVFGLLAVVVCEIAAEPIMGLFAGNEHGVIEMGSQYLRTYVFDCLIAGVHFCFSGYFCAYGKASYSFIHNLLSIILTRVPGAYLASVFYPDNLLPMGIAAPLGSLLSAIICLILYKWKFTGLCWNAENSQFWGIIGKE